MHTKVMAATGLALTGPAHYSPDHGRIANARPKLKGTVLPGGACWMLMRRDDVLEIEARITLETDDKHQIYMTWRGFRHGPKEVIDRLNRGEAVDSQTYYFRTTPYFETSSEKYGWLNRICSVATGVRAASGRTLQVFQVL
jgi:hypothetical protein